MLGFVKDGNGKFWVFPLKCNKWKIVFYRTSIKQECRSYLWRLLWKINGCMLVRVGWSTWKKFIFRVSVFKANCSFSTFCLILDASQKKGITLFWLYIHFISMLRCLFLCSLGEFGMIDMDRFVLKVLTLTNWAKDDFLFDKAVCDISLYFWRIKLASPMRYI